MTSLIREILAEAEQLLQGKKYHEALKMLGEVDRSSLTEEEYGYRCILRSETLLRKGDYSTPNLIYDIDEAIEIFRKGDTEKFARAKYLKGWHLSVLNKYPEANGILIEAYNNYLRCNNLQMQARVLNRLSYSLILTGNVGSAIDNFKNCIRIYERFGNRVSAAKAAHNLAVAFLVTGDFEKCCSTYDSYPMSISTHGDKPVLIYYAMSALCYALRGDIATAIKTIKKCMPYVDKYPHEKGIYLENLGQILILDKDYDSAEKALKSGLKVSPTGSALEAQTRRLLGDLYVATNKFDIAERYTREALKVARSICERKEIAACYRILARIKQHYGEDQNARRWYKKAIDLFELIRSRYELAVTQYLAATSGLYSDRKQKQLLYPALSYFESEDITHCTEKVKAELREVQTFRKAIDRTGSLNKSGNACPTVIASNPQMKALVALAEKVAESDMTVLLTGDTGTGKDVLAHYIHYHSGRSGEFVAQNAAAIPDTMIESELFGSARGAFTGANKDRAGLFEQADGGTFYLDEIADASPEFQAKLLRILETRRVRRLGENKTRRVAFRLIAATNHDLQERIRARLFREDLYYRLNEIRIDLPPLDQHKDDIPALVTHFLTYAGFDLTNGNEKDVKRLGGILSHRSWPGNVRELEHEVKHLRLRSKGDVSQMIRLALQNGPKSKRELLLESLERNNWNRRQVAREWGVSEGTIRVWIKKYGLSED